jgi:hypothetical protein
MHTYNMYSNKDIYDLAKLLSEAYKIDLRVYCFFFKWKKKLEDFSYNPTVLDHKNDLPPL